MKVAVTDLAALIVTLQDPAPVHAPDHPVKVELVFGAAVRVTDVPELQASVQSVPQLMPEGEDVTVPVPVPALLTVRVYGFVDEAKLAVTGVFVFIVRTHCPFPVQTPPDHPVNSEPVFGDAVSVMIAPALYVSEQSEPQLIPKGEDVVVPVPVPDFATDRVYC